MTLISLPNRPLGTDVPSIEAILANFDTITNEVNTSVIQQPQLILAAGGSFDVGNMPLGGSANYFLPFGGYSGCDNSSGGQSIIDSSIPLWANDNLNPPDFSLPNTTSKVKLRALITCNSVNPSLTQLIVFYFAAAIPRTLGANVEGMNLSSSMISYSFPPLTFITPSSILVLESSEAVLSSDPSFYRNFGLALRMGPGPNNGAGNRYTQITIQAQVYAYNS